MSEEPKKPTSAVGYGRPPKDRQFQKGKSGNPKGRRPKQARVFAPRQVRNDILGVTEAPTTIQTADGEITVPTFVAVLMVARKKALSGHGPSIRLLMDRHNMAIAEHWDIDKIEHPAVNTLEREVQYALRHHDEEDLKRRLTRRRRRS